MKWNTIIKSLIIITVVVLSSLNTSCKKEEERGLITLNESSKKFLPKYDTLYFQYHDVVQRYKIAIDAYYYEEVDLGSNSSHHKITASVEHYYKKFTSSSHHLIYHLYVMADNKGKSDVMKFSIMHKYTEEYYEVPIALSKENHESGFPLIERSENLLLGKPLIDSNYYINYDNFNWFLLEDESLLNYSFDNKIWLYIKQ